MHISEGVLSPPVLITGTLLTAGGLVVAVKSIKPNEIPKVALLTSAFFIASLVHVPIGLSNAHLVLNGLLGILLGKGAFAAIFIALVLQAVLFQFGGLTTLGVNTFNIAVPGIIFGVIAQHLISVEKKKLSFIVSWLTGFLSILGSGFLVALSLWMSGENLLLAAQLIFSAHIPVAIVEGFVTATAVSFLLKVKPEIFRR